MSVVYLSNREMKILRLMTQKPEGVSMEELIRVLDVSKRTVYRELSLVEETLKDLGLELSKEEKLYRIEGAKENKDHLITQLQRPFAIEWSDVEKRQFALLTTIALQSKNKYTQTELAELFDVSLTTVQQDFTQLNQLLSKYKIRVERTEEAKLHLTGSEVYIRLYLSQILSNAINEIDFFKVLKQEESEGIETESQYLLSLMDSSLLQMVYQAFEMQQGEILSKISDDNLMNFVLMMTISLMRLENHEGITTAYALDHNQLFPYMQRILSIVKVFQQPYKTLLNISELSFFAMQLRGMNVRKQHSIFQKPYDMELAYNVKYLIQLVSAEFHFNFNQDTMLYHDLINHIGAALKRLDLHLPEIENSVLMKLKEQYTELYAIVEEKLIEVFSPNIFSEQEIGYVVTHFASSYEKYGHEKEIDALVVCTSGIGTSKILKTRLERSIPEIQQVDVVRAVDLDTVDAGHYEVIFSTIMLPGFEHEYTLIDPILDEQEIQTIKQRLNQQPTRKRINVAEPSSERNKEQVFEQVKQLIELSDGMVEAFEIVELEEHFASMNEYLDACFAEDVTLKKKLVQRLKNSPLAIPETGIMLLHTTDESLDHPHLSLHHLKHPIPTTGMDRQPTEVDRIVVMLGPEKMDDLTTEFLGAISSSIIEKEEYTNLYQTGSTEELKNMLKTLSVEVLEKRLK